jgi:hypothetical protein
MGPLVATDGDKVGQDLGLKGFKILQHNHKRRARGRLGRRARWRCFGAGLASFGHRFVVVHIIVGSDTVAMIIPPPQNLWGKGLLRMEVVVKRVTRLVDVALPLRMRHIAEIRRSPPTRA